MCCHGSPRKLNQEADPSQPPANPRRCAKPRRGPRCSPWAPEITLLSRSVVSDPVDCSTPGLPVLHEPRNHGAAVNTGRRADSWAPQSTFSRAEPLGPGAEPLGPGAERRLSRRSSKQSRFLLFPAPPPPLALPGNTGHLGWRDAQLILFF